MRLASVHALQLLTISLEFLLGPRRMSINHSKGSKGAGAPRANRPHTDTLIKHDQDTLMDIVSRDELQRMLDDYTADVKAAVKEVVRQSSPNRDPQERNRNHPLKTIAVWASIAVAQELHHPWKQRNPAQMRTQHAL